VESLGASFLDLGVRTEETAGGYASELTPEQQAQQQKALEERIPTSTSSSRRPPSRVAPRRGSSRRAPVERMRPAPVIVDLAAETGGNCEATVPGEVVEHDGVTVIGTLNLPSTMAYHASQLYSRNVSALLLHLAPEGELVLDWNDEITSGACVTRPEGDA
jgi:NAD(P) transhydrogenase subunit alpha